MNQWATDRPDSLHNQVFTQNKTKNIHRNKSHNPATRVIRKRLPPKANL